MRSFEYRLYRAISWSLLIVLVLLPLAPIFASENESNTESKVEAVTVVEETQTPIVEEPANIETALQNEAVTEPIIESEVIATETDSTQLSTEIITDISPAQETASEENTTAIPPDDAIAVDTEVTETEESASTTESELIVANDETINTSIDIPIDTSVEEESITKEVAQDDSISSTTDEVVLDDNHMVTIGIPVTDENRFSFSKNECVRVNDGSFYCTNATATPSVIGTDRVFSAPDSEGDQEIYIEKAGEVVQITSNQLDDDAPYYDEQSNSLVWHRLVNERYQIISYSLDDEEEEQITNDRYNNMDPSRAGGLTVWQGWVGNDWEIMLLAGDDISMITDNVTEDIAPRINDNYIIWQAFENNAWRVKVYDRLTKEIETIEDADGGSLANPRFVLVYDTEHENGDVETKGYDLRTGEVTPLSATPAPMPERIPDPEQTGEERALVQPVTQIKTKTETEIDPDTEPNNPTNNTDVAPTTDSVLEDIVIPPYGDITATSTVDADTQITEPVQVADDVVILPLEEMTSTATEHILDVLVTPYIEPIVEE